MPGNDNCCLQVIAGTLQLQGKFFKDVNLSLISDTEVKLSKLFCYANFNLAAPIITNDNQLFAKTVTIKADQLINTNEFRALGTMLVDAKQLDNTGSIHGQQVSLKSDNCNHQGIIESNDNLEITSANQFTSSIASELKAKHLKLTVGKKLNLQATPAAESLTIDFTGCDYYYPPFSSKQDVTINHSEDLQLEQSIQADGKVKLSAKQLDITENTKISSSQQQISLDAKVVNNYGQLHAKSDIQVASPSFNHQGQLLSEGSLAFSQPLTELNLQGEVKLDKNLSANFADNHQFSYNKQSLVANGKVQLNFNSDAKLTEDIETPGELEVKVANNKQLELTAQIASNDAAKFTAGDINIASSSALLANGLSLQTTNCDNTYSIQQQGNIQSSSYIKFSGQGLSHNQGSITANGKITSNTQHLNLQSHISSPNTVELNIKQSFSYNENIFQAKNLDLCSADGFELTTPLQNLGGNISIKLKSGGTQPLNIISALNAAGSLKLQASDYPVVVGDSQQKKLAMLSASQEVFIDAKHLDHSWGQTYGQSGVTMQSAEGIINGESVDALATCTQIPDKPFQCQAQLSNGALIKSGGEITFISPLLDNQFATIFSDSKLNLQQLAELNNLSGIIYGVGDTDFTQTIVKNTTLFRDLKVLIFDSPSKPLTLTATCTQKTAAFATIAIVGNAVFDQYLPYAGHLYVSDNATFHHPELINNNLVAEKYKVNLFMSLFAQAGSSTLNLNIKPDGVAKGDNDSYHMGTRTLTGPSHLWCQGMSPHPYEGVTIKTYPNVISIGNLTVNSKHIETLDAIVSKESIVTGFEKLQIGLPLNSNIQLPEVEAFKPIHRLLDYTTGYSLTALNIPATNLLHPLSSMPKIPMTIIQPNGLFANTGNLSCTLSEYSEVVALTNVFMDPSARMLSLYYRNPAYAYQQLKENAYQLQQQFTNSEATELTQAIVARKQPQLLIREPALFYEVVRFIDESGNSQMMLSPVVLLPNSYDDKRLRSGDGCLYGNNLELLKLADAENTQLEISSFVVAKNKLTVSADVAIIGQRQYSYQIEVINRSKTRTLFGSKKHSWRQHLIITKNQPGGELDVGELAYDFGKLLMRGAVLKIDSGGMKGRILTASEWLPNIEAGVQEFSASKVFLESRVKVKVHIPVYAVSPITLQIANQPSPEEPLWALYQAAKRDVIEIEKKCLAITNQAKAAYTPKKPQSMALNLAMGIAAAYAGPAACNALKMTADTAAYAMVSAALSASLQTAVTGGSLKDIAKSAALAAVTAGVCHNLLNAETGVLKGVSNISDERARAALQSAVSTSVGQVLAGAFDGKVDLSTVIPSVLGSAAGGAIIPSSNKVGKAVAAGAVAGVIDGNSESGMYAFVSSLASQLGSAAGQEAFLPKVHEQLNHSAQQLAKEGKLSNISEEQLAAASKQVAALVAGPKDNTIQARQKIVDLGKQLGASSDEECYIKGMTHLLDKTISLATVGSSIETNNVNQFELNDIEDSQFAINALNVSTSDQEVLQKNSDFLILQSHENCEEQGVQSNLDGTAPGSIHENINKNNIQVTSDSREKQSSKFSTATDTENQQAYPNHASSKAAQRKADSLLKTVGIGILDLLVPPAYGNESNDSQNGFSSSSGTQSNESSKQLYVLTAQDLEKKNSLTAEKKIVEKNLYEKRQEFFKFVREAGPSPDIGDNILTGRTGPDQRFIPYIKEIEKLEKHVNSYDQKLKVIDEIGIDGLSWFKPSKDFQPHSIVVKNNIDLARKDAEIHKKTNARNFLGMTFFSSSSSKSTGKIKSNPQGIGSAEISQTFGLNALDLQGDNVSAQLNMFQCQAKGKREFSAGNDSNSSAAYSTEVSAVCAAAVVSAEYKQDFEIAPEITYSCTGKAQMHVGKISSKVKSSQTNKGQSIELGKDVKKIDGKVELKCILK